MFTSISRCHSYGSCRYGHHRFTLGPFVKPCRHVGRAPKRGLNMSLSIGSMSGHEERSDEGNHTWEKIFRAFEQAEGNPQGNTTYRALRAAFHASVRFLESCIYYGLVSSQMANHERDILNVAKTQRQKDRAGVNARTDGETDRWTDQWPD